MVRALFYKFNFPYAQFACNKLSGDLMMNPLWEAIFRLERLGFCVLGVTCDGASINRHLWKLHSNDSLTYKVPNVFAPDRSIYFFSDPPHLLKTIRNSWCNKLRRLWVRMIMIVMLNNTERHTYVLCVV